MRIVAGKYRSRKIVFPDFPDKVRPTMDRVREAIFSSLGSEIEDKNILDLFAGSGAYGLEALSRGAKRVVFVDNFKESIKAIQKNLKSLNETTSDVLFMDYLNALDFFKTKQENFDVIFIDPPYKMIDSYQKVLIFLINNNLVSGHPIFVLESNNKIDFSFLTGFSIKEYHYSDTIVYVLRG